MKLKQIVGSTQSKAKSAPTISVGYYNGRIYFNPPTVELLALKESDCLAFFQDEENPKNWYFSKTKNAGSVHLKRMANKKALSVHNTGIARPMLQSMGLNDSANFFIAEEKVEGKYWKILSDKIVK